MFPNFKRSGVHLIYVLLRRLYFLLLFCYAPALFLLSAIVTMHTQGGLLHFGFWWPFLTLSFFSLPIFLALMLLGVLINHLLCVWTGRLVGKAATFGIVGYSLSFVCLLLTFLTAVTYTKDFLPTLSLVGVCLFCVTSALLFIGCHKRLRREESNAEPPSPALASKLEKVKALLTAVVITALVCAFLFIPFSTVRYDDGGTVKIQALTYTVMKWDRKWDMFRPESGVNYENEPQKTCVYFFPESLKSYDELWDIDH